MSKTLEEIIKETFEDALATIDDGLVDGILDSGMHGETNDEFWVDYNEAFDKVLELLNKRYEEIKRDC